MLICDGLERKVSQISPPHAWHLSEWTPAIAKWREWLSVSLAQLADKTVDKLTTDHPLAPPRIFIGLNIALSSSH